MKPFVIFLFGPPGSGKSTQAERLAQKLGAVHMDTGALLRRILHDPLHQSDPKIQEEKIKQEIRGQLNDSVWVAGIVVEELHRIHATGKSVVSSGFPRTVFEGEIELPVFRDLYGNQLFLIKLEVSEATTLARNSTRRMCADCQKMFTPLDPGSSGFQAGDEGGISSTLNKNPAPKSSDLTGLTATAKDDQSATCPACGGRLILRADDNPETIRHRLQVYKERSAPLFDYFAEKQIREVVINGEPAPDIVFDEILVALKDFL